MAAPAVGADAARPTNFESVLDTVEPSDTPVELSVVGGDSFLQARAPAGVTVEIPGYDGEPYLRIGADGIVERNRRSPASYLNENRDGSTDGLPDGVSSSAPPEWERIGDGGVVAWHDHRIHWMLNDAPETPEDRVVQVWTVDLVVDGTDVTATGRLLHRDDLAPWPLVVTAAVAAAAWWFGRRPATRRMITAAAAALATAGSLSWYLANPPGAEPSWVPTALAAGALAVAAVLALADRRGRWDPGRHVGARGAARRLAGGSARGVLDADAAGLVPAGSWTAC